jgi:hypothetical protein
MSLRLIIATALGLAAVLLFACSSIRGEECGTTSDCWDGLTCVGFPAVCPAGCEPTKGKCERACDEKTPCGPNDLCSTQTIPVRSVSDNEFDPVHICLPPDRDAGVH